MTEVPAIIRAIKSGILTEVKSLLESQPEILKSEKGESGESLLLLAAYHGNQAVTDILLQHQPELTIHEATATNNLERVKALLSNDKNLVNAISPDGFTPLGLACYFGFPDIAQYLLNQGADANTASQYKLNASPLHQAVTAGNLELITLLIENGADVNARQTDGLTPLHVAAHRGDGEIIKFLLTQHADINTTNSAGETPMDLAIKSGHEAASWFSL